jgi:hypothetical protein
LTFEATLTLRVAAAKILAPLESRSDSKQDDGGHQSGCGHWGKDVSDDLLQLGPTAELGLDLAS